MLSFSQVARANAMYLVGFILLLFVVKPTLLFKPDGKQRTFGVGTDDQGFKKTLYTIPVLIVVFVALVTTFQST